MPGAHTHIGEVWDLHVLQAEFKKVVNKWVWRFSRLEDKNKLAQSSNAWMLINSYVNPKNLSYLEMYTIRNASKTSLSHSAWWPCQLWTMGHLGRCTLQKKCAGCAKRKLKPSRTCPNLLEPWRKLLCKDFNNINVRTCRQAIVEALNPANTILNIQFVQFIKKFMSMIIT